MAQAKILIVDDEYAFAEFAKLLLESMNYQVVISLEATNAWGVAAAEKPSLILMDISMPEMNGVEVIQKLKSDPSTKDIPIIVCSITKTQAQISAAFEFGAEDYMRKPLKSAQLKLQVERALAPQPA